MEKIENKTPVYTEMGFFLFSGYELVLLLVIPDMEDFQKQTSISLPSAGAGLSGLLLTTSVP